MENNIAKNKNMNEKRDMIYLAALLHDIGKFYQRAYPGKSDFTKDIADKELLNFVTRHLKSEDFDEKIIQHAKLFSNSERLQTADEDYQQGVLNQPLLSIFSSILSDENSYKKFLPLKKLDIDNIPKLADNPNETSSNEYEELWNSFIKEFSELKDVTNTKVFAETFLKLLEKYTVYIPSSTKKNEIPNVSLFDHSKTTAAFAVSIFNYLEETGDLVDAVQNSDNKPFILIGADLSGIQDFIYDIIGKNASKNLKGRSFFIQILMESVVRLILKELGLYKANVIYSAGGNFYIIAQNTDNTISKLNKLILKINSALADAYRRKLYLALDYTEFGKKDLIDEGRLGEIWEELISVKLGKKKKQRYLNELNPDLFKPTNLSKEALTHDGALLKDIITGEVIYKNEETGEMDNKKVRYTTIKQIELGKRLRDAKYWVISFDKHPNTKDEYTFNPFDERFMNDKKNKIEIYNYFFSESPGYFNNAEIISLNKFDSFNKTQTDNIQSFDFYGGDDFPIYTEKDLEENPDNEDIKLGDIKQFDDLAKGKNLDRLGVLRMDVDNLGKIFALGLPENMRTFSRFATLSRSIDWFFRGYLNTIWEDFREDTMIIYSGGDDLFIIGRWDKTIHFAERIKDDFKTWTCDNPGLTLSGGVAIVTGKFPVLKAAAMAGDFEDEAKGHSISKGDCMNISKNAFTLFGEPLNWEYEFPVVKEIKEKIIEFSKKDAPKSFARILVQFQMIREKQHEQNEKYEEGRTDKRVNESWYWMILYYLKRFAENHRKDNTELSLYAELIQKDILANTYKGETLFFLNKSNHILNYYALAARWAELEMRTIEK